MSGSLLSCVCCLLRVHAFKGVPRIQSAHEHTPSNPREIWETHRTSGTTAVDLDMHARCVVGELSRCACGTSPRRSNTTVSSCCVTLTLSASRFIGSTARALTLRAVVSLAGSTCIQKSLLPRPRRNQTCAVTWMHRCTFHAVSEVTTQM